MKLQSAQELIYSLVKTGKTHPDYKEVVELAEKLTILITGKNTAKLLRREVTRESIEAFVQRCQITKSITPAVAASVKIPFYKVARNQRIKAIIDLKNEAKQKVVEQMVNGFYGGANAKSKGMDYWLKTRFMDLTFTDPNAWVVIEWDTPQSKADVIKPRPYEISAAEAVNFSVINEEILWLLCKKATVYNAGSGDKIKEKAGFKFTLYEKDFTVTYQPVDKEYLDAMGFRTAPNQRLLDSVNTKQLYLETVNEPKIGFVPAIRVGYLRDLSTNSRTFANPFNDAMCYFDKSIKVVSEFDLTMTGHVFPQRIEYAPVCKGLSAQKKCNSGYFTDGTVCTVCHGSGFAGIKSAQDVLRLPMPEKGTPNAEIIDLTKLVAYVTPSIELIQFQKDYIDDLGTKVHGAVFNSQVFVKKQGGGQDGSGQPIQTATENDNNMQSVYDALEPFTEKYSDTWKAFVTTCVLLTGQVIDDSVNVDHIFPADYKLKSADILLSELKTINDSGAPAFMKEICNNDLAEIQFQGDPLGLIKYRVKRRFFPFSGKSDDQIAISLSSPNVPRRSKILYENFELIFSNIEMTNPEFYTTPNRAKQSELVEAEIEKLKETIDAETPAMSIDMFRSGLNTSGGDANPGGDGNPGGQDQQPPKEPATK